MLAVLIVFWLRTAYVQVLIAMRLPSGRLAVAEFAAARGGVMQLATYHQADSSYMLQYGPPSARSVRMNNTAMYQQARKRRSR